jgi:hypothetical protein
MPGVEVVQGMETAQERTMRLMGQAAQAIGGAMAQRQQRQDQEVQQGIEMMARNPELSKTLGRDLMQRYGKNKRFQHLGPIVDLLGREVDATDRGESAYGKYMGQVEGLSTELDAVEQEAQKLPDAIPMGGMPGAPPMMAPNPVKQQALQRIGQARQSPEQMFLAAGMQFGTQNPSEWAAARNYAKAHGQFFPELDISQFPPEIRAIMQKQNLPPDAQKAADIAAKLTKPAGEMTDAERIAAETKVKREEMGIADTLATAREELARTGTAQREAADRAGRVNEIYLKARLDAEAEARKAEGERKPAKVSGTAKDHAAAATAQLTEAGLGAESLENKPYLGHVQALMDMAEKDAADMGIYDQDQVNRMFQDLFQKYIGGLRAGKSPYAFKLATNSGAVSASTNYRAKQ